MANRGTVLAVGVAAALVAGYLLFKEKGVEYDCVTLKVNDLEVWNAMVVKHYDPELVPTSRQEWEEAMLIVLDGAFPECAGNRPEKIVGADGEMTFDAFIDFIWAVAQGMDASAGGLEPIAMALFPPSSVATVRPGIEGGVRL